MIIVKETSQNSKLGKNVSTTYAPLTSCPSTCPFKKSGGCYALQGPCGFHFRRITTATRQQKASADRIADREATAIKKLSGAKPLRIHTTGDCRTEYSARVIAAAAAIYIAKHGQPTWTYTHAQNVSRDAWGSVSVLRSCHSMEEVNDAWKQSYAVSLVVCNSGKKHTFDLGNGFRGVLCPAQWRDTTCDKCRLCFKDKMLHEKRVVICFEVHGALKKMAARDAVVLTS